ncbi:MAG: tRNA (adenosine(37)-N6)-threonylcarbamoyltransferase complex transferase subunit TsaD [Candidatus Levybacteria bacterium]|nr:tRNA (adenosine(37)-N6)-threonylcarbamoyltransferase complex transferase subunit TsaD [Candidatus Levybacteria bacterium]
MILLGIETSCDETGAAIASFDPKKQTVSLLSNTVASSMPLHAATGGIIPETAAREQIKYILPVINEAIQKAYKTSLIEENLPVDAIAVTIGPGLIGSLLVGVETARTLAYLWQKPLIAVNHLYGHIYANWIYRKETIQFPALALVVSGGHTDFVLMRSHNDIKVIGATRDDAAGEAFDKIGRLLDLPYPAGPHIAKLAEKGDPKKFSLPRPMIGSHDFDVSFSGLKTAALNLTKRKDIADVILRRSRRISSAKRSFGMSHTVRPFAGVYTDRSRSAQDDKIINDLCASVEQAIVDVLVKKTINAAKKYDVKSLLLGGGVAANEHLRKELEVKSSELKVNLFAPEKRLCTDNAAMIAAAGFFTKKRSSWQEISADPELYY